MLNKVYTLFSIRYETTTNRRMREAHRAFDGGPGDPIEPAYRRYDASGDVVAVVQHFEVGKLSRDAKTGDVTWRSEDAVMTWDVETGQVRVSRRFVGSLLPGY